VVGGPLDRHRPIADNSDVMLVLHLGFGVWHNEHCSRAAAAA
jgi:hypothetical protein